MKQLLSLMVFVLVLGSCKDQQSSKQTTFDFSKLVGDWKTIGENPSTLERWTLDGEIMNGASFSVDGSDMEIQETIRIENLKGAPVYSPRVVNQNDGHEVHFTCVNQNSNRIEFVNEQHDFPQVILYEFIHEDSLQATISSFPLNAKSKKFTFSYSRVKGV
jgi:hypothetical protein